MKNYGQFYLLGTWTVKPGKVQDFIKAWQSFANWIAENQPGAEEGVLLQDVDNPREFVSFSSWADAEKIEELQSRPEMQAFISEARNLIEEIQPRIMRVAGYFGSAGGPD